MGSAFLLFQLILPYEESGQQLFDEQGINGVVQLSIPAFVVFTLQKIVLSHFQMQLVREMLYALIFMQFIIAKHSIPFRKFLKKTAVPTLFPRPSSSRDQAVKTRKSNVVEKMDRARLKKGIVADLSSRGNMYRDYAIYIL